MSWWSWSGEAAAELAEALATVEQAVAEEDMR